MCFRQNRPLLRDLSKKVEPWLEHFTVNEAKLILNSVSTLDLEEYTCYRIITKIQPIYRNFKNSKIAYDSESRL